MEVRRFSDPILDNSGCICVTVELPNFGAVQSTSYPLAIEHRLNWLFAWNTFVPPLWSSKNLLTNVLNAEDSHLQ
jgi:hypothetical protein